MKINNLLEVDTPERATLKNGAQSRYSDKARAFLAKKPTYIGIVAGTRYYEHPEKGDESPLMAITPEGELKLSDFWELPDIHDVM